MKTSMVWEFLQLVQNWAELSSNEVYGNYCVVCQNIQFEIFKKKSV